MDFLIHWELMILSMVMNMGLDYALHPKPNESMVCEEGYVLILAKNECLEGRQVPENCDYSEQCKYFDTNTYCDDSWQCAIKCQTGQEFNAKIDRCVKKLNDAIKSKLRDLVTGLKSRNKSALTNFNQLFLTNGSRKINLFSLLERSTTSRSSVCSSDYHWNNNTNICEANPILVYSGSLLMTIMFSVAFISIILMFYRRRHNETINLFQTLNSFNFANNTALGPNVYFVAIPSNDNPLPTYQECVEQNESNSSKLPSYEEAIAVND